MKYKGKPPADVQTIAVYSTLDAHFVDYGDLLLLDSVASGLTNGLRERPIKLSFASQVDNGGIRAFRDPEDVARNQSADCGQKLAPSADEHCIRDIKHWPSASGKCEETGRRRGCGWLEETNHLGLILRR
jgi:hypothetical protein